MQALLKDALDSDAAGRVVVTISEEHKAALLQQWVDTCRQRDEALLKGRVVDDASSRQFICGK